MNHLKSSLWDLRWIFERSMTVRALAETLVTLAPQGKPYPEKASSRSRIWAWDKRQPDA